MSIQHARTEAELHFDTLIAQRRRRGRETYGRGLTHTDDYDWNQMALEEALDLAQYLSAENLILRQRAKQIRDTIARVIAWPDDVMPRGVIEEEMRRQRNAMAERITQMPVDTP
jgi:nucleotide-binding universal stress UspA family protein